MTVRQIREMDALEFMQWNVYYAKQAQKQELEMKKAKR